MKNIQMMLVALLAAGLLAACSAATTSESLPGGGAFPTATKSFLFEGKAPAISLDAPVSLSGAPTVANVFRMPPSATPLPVVPPTNSPEPTATQPAQPQFFEVNVYGDGLNPNWEVQQDGKSFNFKSPAQVSRDNQVVSFVPRPKGDSTLLFSVADRSDQVYRRDQAVKLSFWLYSPDAAIYLDQFFITIVGSNSQPYWSAKDQSVNESDFRSVFPEIGLDRLGFEHAIPANTWVMAEIDLDQASALEPAYQYLTGISFNSTAGLNHTLLIDDIRLTLLSQPSHPSTLESTPTTNSK